MFNKLQDFLLPHLANRNAAAAPRIGEPAALPAPPAVARPHQQVAGHDAQAAARPGQAAEQRAAAGLRAEAAVARDAAPVRQPVAAGNVAVARRDVPAVPAPQALQAQRDQRVIAPACNAVVPRAQQGAVNNPLRNPVVRQAPNGRQAAPAAANVPARPGVAAAPLLAHLAAPQRAAAPGLLPPPLWAAPPVAVQAAVRPEAQPVIRPAAQLAAPPVDQAAAPRAVQQAVPAAPQARGPYPVRRPDPAIIARQAAEEVLKLRDLRIGDEQDHELAFAPPIPVGTFQPIVPPVDAASAGLEGRAYLEFLVKDIRTEAGMAMILREDVLDSAEISEDRVNDIANRMRPIMAQIYADPHLATEMEMLITQALTFCHDRLELAIGEMEDTALLAHLSAGRINEITLFNYGVAFFMLNDVREKVKQLIHEAMDGGEAYQSSHDVLNAIYYLQDDLHLPTTQREPLVPRAVHGIVSERVAREVIGPYVKQRAIEKDGQNVWRFLSTWQPWITHVDRHEALAQEMTESFRKLMNDTEEKQAERVAAGRGMDDQQFLSRLNQLGKAHTSTKSELAFGIAKELLFNWRAEYLALQGRLPPYFG